MALWAWHAGENSFSEIWLNGEYTYTSQVPFVEDRPMRELDFPHATIVRTL